MEVEFKNEFIYIKIGFVNAKNFVVQNQIKDKKERREERKGKNSSVFLPLKSLTPCSLHKTWKERKGEKD
jgi:hypothetical protein